MTLTTLLAPMLTQCAAYALTALGLCMTLGRGVLA